MICFVDHLCYAHKEGEVVLRQWNYRGHMFTHSSFMKINKNKRKKKGGARGVQIPGGGTVVYAHVTSMENGHLVSKPLSRAETRKLAHGPIAATQPKLKEALAKQVVSTEG